MNTIINIIEEILFPISEIKLKIYKYGKVFALIHIIKKLNQKSSSSFISGIAFIYPNDRY